MLRKTSGLPTGAKHTPRRRPAPPPSTILTSPVSPSTRRQKGKKPIRAIPEEESDYDELEAQDDYESENGFEDFVPPRDFRIGSASAELGPPITTDDRMRNLPELHRITVHNFVRDARRQEEALRNELQNRKPYFTETEFREMAISWTLTLDEMYTIPGITHDNVKRHGKRFIPLIKQFHNSYNEMMDDQTNNYDQDENHNVVIDLCDSDEGNNEEEDDDDLESQVGEPSRFFTAPNEDVMEFNRKMELVQVQPSTTRREPTPPRKSKGKPFGKGKHGSRKSRNSAGSASSASTSWSRGGRSNSGVAKKQSAARKPTLATTGPKTAKKSSIMDSFGRAGTGSGGFSAMPT
jgi:bloom syndrome protein